MSELANRMAARDEPAGYRGENLLFIISQPRSGSTLLQRVLAGHPDIQTSAETWLMLHPAYGLRGSGIDAEFDSRWRANAVSQFLEHYTDGVEVYDEATRRWAETIYGNALARSGRALFLDKTPRYFFIIPDLVRLFPRARFVFLLRNPMAVLASELETYVKGNWPALSLFAADLLEAPDLILQGMDQLGSSAIVVRYEEFVSHPAEATARLCQRLGIPFHEPMIDYAATPTPKGTMNDPVGVHRHTRPSTSSLEKWTRLADDPQTCLFAAKYLERLGPGTVGAMGYPYDDIHALLSRGRPHSERGLFPWEIAITPRSQWNARQRFQVERYFAVQKKGPVRGTVRALRHTARRWLRTARHELSRQPTSRGTRG